MTMERTYLDYNASAPLRPEARDAVVAAMALCGNPSSVHTEGRKARGLVEQAREDVAALVGANAEQVVFTSGATESNASVFAARWNTVYVSDLEHPSVLAPAIENADRIVKIPAGANGCVELSGLAAQEARTAAPDRSLIVLQLANNETGVLQPVGEAAAYAHKAALAFHCDAVQAAGRVVIDFAELGADTLSFSSHKIGGPKGAGALIVRDGATPYPSLIKGGGQERRRRAGTENVAAIAGFGAAAAAAKRDLSRMEAIRDLRDGLERAMTQITPEAIIIGRQTQRVANTSCIALPGKLAETLVIQFDLAGIAVSSGSACSSGKVAHSKVLEAMGLPREIAAGAVRISLGHETTQRDCDAFLAAWTKICAPQGRRRNDRITAEGFGGPLHLDSGVH